MSHISTYATDLQLNPVKGQRAADTDRSWQLFREALAAVAEENDGYVSDSITNYYGHQRKCTFSLIVPKFRYGLGVDVDEKTGKVSFVYDAYGVREEIINDLKDRVMQTFTALAVSRTLQDMQYQVELDERPEEQSSSGRRQVMVRGVM
ncbi:MAG: hypothetical protein R6U70_03915 [Bacillota bacterium]